MQFPSQVAVELVHQHNSELPDLILVERLQQGCSDCFSLLYYRYCHTVYSIAWNVLHDRAEAEDIVQEVFLSIHLQRSRYDLERGSVKTWILHSVHFKALTRRRQLKGELFDSIETERLTDQSFGSKLQSNEIDSVRIFWVDRGLTLLNERQRQVIELVHFEGYTLLESSKVIGESMPNTRNLYYRGMKLLRKSLMPSSVSSTVNRDMSRKERVTLQPKTPILEH